MKVETIKGLWIKYRYAVCVFAVGLLFILMPGKKASDSNASAPVRDSVLTDAESAEKRLADVLSKTKGVGDVRVLLSYQCSEERLYTRDDGETVLISVGSGKQEALEKKTVYPIYQGAVIICSGAEDPVVEMRIIEAVHQFTGLRTDQISVLPLA